MPDQGVAEISHFADMLVHGDIATPTPQGVGDGASGIVPFDSDKC
jgi:hypothetical protein